MLLGKVYTLMNTKITSSILSSDHKDLAIVYAMMSKYITSDNAYRVMRFTWKRKYYEAKVDQHASIESNNHHKEKKNKHNDSGHHNYNTHDHAPHHAAQANRDIWPCYV